MGMRSGKALKLKKIVAKKAPKRVAKKVVAKKAVAKKAVAKKAVAKKAVAKKVVAKKAVAKPAAKAPAPKVVTRTVTTDKNAALRAIAQRIVDATVANDEAAMFVLYDERVESQEANNPPNVGLAALREKFAAFAAMMTDGAFLPRSVAADGKTIIIEWDGRMTLTASGRVVEMREIAVHEIENGKIVRERFYYDPALLAP